MTQPGLFELFEAALRDAALLLATLQEEFRALSRPDTVTIEEIVARKRELVVRLEDESARRAVTLRTAGFADGTADMGEWLSQVDNTPDRRILRLWQDFTVMLCKCQQQNQVNGRVIDVNRRRVHDVYAFSAELNSIPDFTIRAGQLRYPVRHARSPRHDDRNYIRTA